MTLVNFSSDSQGFVNQFVFMIQQQQNHKNQEINNSNFT